ncbi:MAG: haloacid dehalogenase [Methyloligella sp.]|nr:MAG: haloacid dehalogenase [Methyloligella sp.]
MYCILFDCDGTIVDSEALIVRAMQDAFEAQSLVAPSPQEIQQIIGLSLPIAVEVLCMPFENVEVNQSLIENIGEGYKASYQHLRDELGHPEPLFEGTHELLARLKAQDDVFLGIATGKSMKGVQGLLKRFELEDVFHTIQTACNAPSKPHPGMIEQALKETGAEAHRTVMIGDTTFDMEMAQNAGVPSIGVTWGHHEKEELLPFAPKMIVDEFSDLLSAIQETLSIDKLGIDKL